MERLSAFGRLGLAQWPSPIERLRRLEGWLAGSSPQVRLFAKRDDLGSVGGGGSKLRKLEYLLADALAQGADTLICFGSLQSNHARLSAAAAARVGLRCELVLASGAHHQGPDHELNGNVLLDHLFGAVVHRVQSIDDAAALAIGLASSLKANRTTPYLVELGGSSPMGCLGYAAAALEILEQEKMLGVEFDEIVVPNGSSGTHAGLVAGFAYAAQPRKVTGYCVYTDAPETLARTRRLFKASLDMLRGADTGEAELFLDDSQLGAGYGMGTDASLGALKLLARTEGLLADPVYGAKALAGLLAAAEAGKYNAGSNILLLMTGGSPALFAYRSDLEMTEA